MLQNLAEKKKNIGRKNQVQSITKSGHPRGGYGFIESYGVQKGFRNIQILRIGFGSDQRCNLALTKPPYCKKHHKI